ncbi:MAG TPA: hypothetical protein VFJ96_07395, partial [Gemmatimonadaceae bacterium]|nr:hypothetical protein [Gemmatimonadaceae bacterium]
LHRTSDIVDALPQAKTAGLSALTRRAAKRIATFDRRRAPDDARGRSRPVDANGRSDGVRARAEHLALDLRAVATTATSTRGTLSALQHDTALDVTLRDVSRQLAVIGSLLGRSRGSAGRFLNDSAIAHTLHGNR